MRKENTTEASRLRLITPHATRSLRQHKGYNSSVSAGISISAATISILIAVLHYYRAARRATTGALALPIPLLPEDQIPLHAEPEHPVPMLSVQSAGCAGMERLGVPTRTTLNAPPDDRGHISRRIRMDTCDLLVRDAALLSDRQIRNNNHYHRVGCGINGSSYSLSNSSNIRVGIESAAIRTAQQQQSVATKLKPINNDNHQQQQQLMQHQQNIRCPHHVPLPDSEWGQDRDLQIRTRYQQSEITRSYIKPPPNKTVLDVPEQSYNFYSTTMLSSAASSVANSGISCNLRANLANQQSSSNNHHNHHQQQPCFSGLQQPQQHHQQTAILSQQQHKSKPNVITKLFSRKSSPKSPTALCPSSSVSSNSSLSSSASSSSSSSLSSPSPSSSSVSTSSSSSSLCSAQILPISTAATLTATTCTLGAAAPIQNNQMPTNNSSNITSNSTFLPTIGATRGSPSPPLAVTVPVAATMLPQQQQQQQQFHSQQRQQQQKLLLANSTNSSNLSSTSLHLLKSSSCNLSSIYNNTSPCSSPSFTNVAAATLDIPSTSIDCCYAQATSIQRSRSSSATSPSTSQQQQSIDNNCGNSNSSSNSSINSISSMSSSRNYQHHI